MIVDKSVGGWGRSRSYNRESPRYNLYRINNCSVRRTLVITRFHLNRIKLVKFNSNQIVSSTRNPVGFNSQKETISKINKNNNPSIFYNKRFSSSTTENAERERTSSFARASQNKDQ